MTDRVPGWAERAVLECFYGPLWTPGERAGVLDAAADAGATDYVYGPAADERTGGRWREPYGADAEPLADLVERARARGVRTTWRVSPGAPLQPARGVRFADADDQAVLQARIADAAALGFDRVLVALDDLGATLGAADRAAFGHDPAPVAAAHAHLLNAAAAAASGVGLGFLACPQHYWGVEPSAYRRRLAELLAPGVPVVWTGPGVTSATITVADAARVVEQWGRPVWLWDNHPVNDWDGLQESFTNDTRPRRLPLTPLAGREPGLAGVLAGYGSNAGLDPRLTLPATVAALTWAADPAGYRPEDALADAATRLGLPAVGIRALAAVAGASPVWTPPGDAATLAARALADASAAPAASEAFAGLIDDLAGLRASGGAFAPWADAAAEQLRVAVDALAIMRGEAVDAAGFAEAVQRVRGEGRSIAHGTLLALADHARGLVGAPPPPLPDAG